MKKPRPRAPGTADPRRRAAGTRPVPESDRHDPARAEAAPLMGVTQLAETLGYSRQAVDAWRLRGCPVHEVAPGRYLYRLSEVTLWLLYEDGYSEPAFTDREAFVIRRLILSSLEDDGPLSRAVRRIVRDELAAQRPH